MAVKIRLKRFGKIHAPFYRVVVADSRTRRDGRAIEEIGLYQPLSDPSFVKIDSERAQYWLGVGAQPTDQVRAILKLTGDWQKFKGEPGTEGTLQQPKGKEAFVAPEGGSVLKEATTPKGGKKDDASEEVVEEVADAEAVVKEDNAVAEAEAETEKVDAEKSEA